MTYAARVLTLALAAVLAVGGCGPGSSGGDGASGHGGGGHGGVDVSLLPSKPARPMTVQQLAGDLGCPAKLAGKFADYRQVTCQYGHAKVILLDFDKDKGQADWLELSKLYGGVYLVGERWVVSGNSLEEISPLQDKFGGKIEEGEQHGVPPPSSQAKPAG